ncbi:hypothetical protein C8R43DRAFT_911735 [Mycena crocata]|nr:hypothetical protein C8R43DRAFT_911735 [Mycena crocata]
MHADLPYLRTDTVQPLPQKSKLAPALRAHYGVHPILSLPVELVALIFFHCLPDRQELNAGTAPLLLTRICGHWRDIALRTPELWSSVFFELFHVAKDRLVSKMRMLKFWLDRGAAHPLTLYLHYRQPFTAAAPLIAEQSSRWRDVDLFLHPTTLAAFSSAGGLQLPQLRRLSLGCLQATDADADAGQPVITAFSVAPQLTDVSLLKLAPSSVVLPWAQLTSFYAQCADLEEGMRVLHSAPRMQHLRLDLQRLTHGAPSSEPCIHTSLLSLTIQTHPAAPLPVRTLLAPLTLPSLLALDVPPLAALDVPAFVDFLARSGCALQRLALPIAPLPTGALHTALANLPALSELSLQYAGAAPLLDLLSALAEEAAFLPSLRNVHVDCFRATVPYIELAEALAARWDWEGRVDVDADLNVVDAGVKVVDAGVKDVDADLKVVDGEVEETKLMIAARATKTDEAPTQLRAFSMSVLTRATHTNADADVAALDVLRALKVRGMGIEVSHVYGASVV